MRGHLQHKFPQKAYYDDDDDDDDDNNDDDDDDDHRVLSDKYKNPKMRSYDPLLGRFTLTSSIIPVGLHLVLHFCLLRIIGRAPVHTVPIYQTAVGLHVRAQVRIITGGLFDGREGC
jgi:hypothetical protein